MFSKNGKRNYRDVASDRANKMRADKRNKDNTMVVLIRELGKLKG